MKTTPTTHDEYRLAFFHLLLKKLMECADNTSPEDLVFTPEDEKVAEYYCKDLSIEPVAEHLSTGDCVSCFKRRITRLIDSCHKSHQIEWDRIETFMQKLEGLIQKADRICFNAFQAHFQQVPVEVSAD